MTKHSIMKLYIIIFRIVAPSVTTLSIMTPSTMKQPLATQHNDILHNDNKHIKTQHNETLHNYPQNRGMQYYNTQHNDT